MSTIKVDTITDEAGSGAPDFPNGMTGSGSALTGIATAAQGTLADTALQATSSLNSANLTGALPAIDGSALTGVGGSTTYGDVGTYALLWATAVAQRSPGATRAGSGLYPANTMTATNLSGDYNGAGSPSGTWRLMGQTGYYNSTIALSRRDFMASVWVRIS